MKSDLNPNHSRIRKYACQPPHFNRARAFLAGSRFPLPKLDAAWTSAGHFEIHLNNRRLLLPFMLTVLQAPGILTTSIDGLLPFITELSSTDCTIGNIPKQVAFVLTSAFP
ncbi:hypothetical protein AVEN_234697-1 [Araneus ventricosus]|uniref:Uncharacterized protein n=1 Tax=Araneus ventricosus TaxID=182803 RepID=A0A4Y2J2P7_ARAVE|nr:hypothetical protein AVEN_234697-1 [Araneus ventricosus]